MTRDRAIQLIAVVILILSTVASGRILPIILDQSEKNVLRYTNVSVKGAPPWVAIGTAIGALRGLIVDILWMKINSMKSKGLFYEIMADAEMITKLQPRFAEVWAFHGHNMTYNISVAMHTERERWEWVNAGIRLVRNEGIRANPNDMYLHKELAFWFAHKIEGQADDAHLYYKTEFCKEWHYLLGEPPIDYKARIAWIKVVADAPDSLEEAEVVTPGVLNLVDKLQTTLSDLTTNKKFQLDREFLRLYSEWRAIRGQSAVARALNFGQQILESSEIFRAVDEIISDPEHVQAGHTLIAYLRKRILKNDYNMDPQIMYEFTRDLGPIDWRHAQAHALYWARLGSKMGEGRIANEDIYHNLNTDRLQIQGMQALARSGRISFDPFSSELPGRFPEPRWIDAIDKEFEHLYIKYYNTFGAGGESFIGFIQNFLSAAVREWYRAGEREKALKLYARLDSLFGSGALIPNNKYSVPLEVFVRKQTQGQYEMQPYLAPNDIAASLRYGFRVGIGQDRKEVWEDALKFASDVTTFFKTNEWNEYTTKFGSGRIADLVGVMENSVIIAFEVVMTDPSIEIRERAVIWSKVDQYDPQLRPRVYDRILPQVEQQFAQNVLAQRYTVHQLFPAPPNMEAFRQQLIAEKIRKDEQRQKERIRDQMESR